MFNLVRFLLTCDDGYNSPGLLASKKAVENLGEVYVYATETQNTAGGSKMTVNKPVKYYKRKLLDGTECISVDGTPVDVVRLALLHDLKDKKPDFVISGINIGEQISNSAIIMSGTCSAAFMASCMGIPSLAFGYTPDNEEIKYIHHTNHNGFEHMFDFPQKVEEKIVKWVLKNNLMGADWLNINIPTKKTDKIKVVHAIRDGYYDNGIDKKKDHFFNIGLPFKNKTFPEDSDAEWIKNAVTIVPCHVDFTDHEKLKRLKVLENELKFKEV